MPVTRPDRPGQMEGTEERGGGVGMVRRGGSRTKSADLACHTHAVCQIVIDNLINLIVLV